MPEWGYALKESLDIGQREEKGRAPIHGLDHDANHPPKGGSNSHRRYENTRWYFTPIRDYDQTGANYGR